jgi:MFS superfamily sulfate permease-like transporter
MNAELKGHGISNLISGITGGVPNYLCYSSSVTYFKCNGGSK